MNANILINIKKYQECTNYIKISYQDIINMYNTYDTDAIIKALSYIIYYIIFFKTTFYLIIIIRDYIAIFINSKDKCLFNRSSHIHTLKK